MHWGELSAEKKWKMADNLWKEIQLEIKGAIPFGLTNWQKLKKKILFSFGKSMEKRYYHLFLAGI